MLTKSKVIKSSLEMIRFYLILFLVSSVSLLGFSQSANDIFQQANDAYINKSYDQAIQLYESIYAQDLKSPELFLNLGNAYFQKAAYAKSILAYERGLKISPNDKAILENLEIANNQLDSEIIEVPPFILVRWWRSFSHIFSTTIWAVLQLLLLGSIAFFVGRYFLHKNNQLKRQSLRVAILLMPFLLVAFLAGATKDKAENDQTAVIMSETALTDGPDERSGEINKLYPGNTVLLLDQIGDWHKVKLANQSVGWIPDGSMEKI